MALKFLNKKGWHTGSLRNIENVWKAEQKHDAEQKKLEELRKQIHEERERSEFRLLQEQAGLVPKQERLDFLYDSGLAVGKGSSSSAAGGSGAGGGGFKALEEALPSTKGTDASGNQSSGAPGALFEDKPHSANDTWRKLHSDPLLMIRQREQEALARIKNNPVQMAIIRKSAVEKKQKEKSEKSPDHKEHRKNRRRSSKHQKHSSSNLHSDSEENLPKEDKKDRNHHHKRSDYEGHRRRNESVSEDELKKTERHEKSRSRQKCGYDDQDAVKRNHDNSKRGKYSSQAPRSIDADKNKEKRDKYSSQAPRSIDADKNHEKDRQSYDHESDSEDGLKKTERQEKSRIRQKYGYNDQDSVKRSHDKSKRDIYSSQAPRSIDADRNQEKERRSYDHRATTPGDDKRRGGTSKLSEEERAARLREMQEDAELHEEQRWKRLKKAEENDAREATVSSTSAGRNFLDAAHKSIYGAEKGGSSTIEESVRRRAHFSQGRYLSEGNAFRR